ncbi:MAG: hypothetical protein M0C28_11555 [Candidatus Moduliflexus flocculans]|nr:hypothetical protein [Candidatus Moduliflexus flocculans]
MAEFTPTRSLAIALAEERRTMREGYAFLDEKCLLLAGEMLREVRQHRQHRSRACRAAGTRRERRAAGRRRAPWPAGPAGVSGRPLAAASCASSGARCSGVAMQRRARCDGAARRRRRAADAGRVGRQSARGGGLPARLRGAAAAAAPCWPRCQRQPRHACTPSTGATVRRVRALQDVLLPEIERTLADIETQPRGTRAGRSRRAAADRHRRRCDAAPAEAGALPRTQPIGCTGWPAAFQPAKPSIR